MLRAARETVIVCGDEVARGDAVGELVALAEATGAAVYADVLPARLNFPNQHPHFRDRMARDQDAIRARMGGAEAILLVGGQFFEEVWFVDAPPFPEHARIIQLEASGASIGRNYRVDCGLVGDLKLTLSALARQLGANGEDSGERAAVVRARREEHARRKEASRERQRSKAAARGGNLPMSTAALMAGAREGAPGGHRGRERGDHGEPGRAAHPRFQGTAMRCSARAAAASARVCRARSRSSSRSPRARCSRYPATARRSTPSRRCGPPPTGVSTSCS